MAQHVRVDIASADRVLAGTLVHPDQPSGAAVLLVHGLGSSRATNVERAEALADRVGATSLAIDLGGHGDSTGRLTQMTPRRNLADVVAAFDALVAVPGVRPDRVGVCAASYGAYLAVLLTASRRVAQLVLRAPALYTDDSFDSGLAGRRLGDARSAATTLAHLGLCPGPVTIVESEFDEVISSETVAAFLAANPRARHVVQPGARHALTDPAWRAAYLDLVVGAFETL